MNLHRKAGHAALSLLLVGCLGCLGCGGGGSDDEGPGESAPKNRAVAVGVAEYLDPVYPGDLDFPALDATDFANTLRAADEWNSDDVQLLTDDLARKADIEAAIAAAGAGLSAGDRFVFFFSGHGAVGPDDLYPFDEADGLDEYICPYDTDPFVWDYDIRDDELEEWLREYIPEGVNICVIIDACNSGGMGKGKSLAEGLADDFMRAKGTALAKDIDKISSLVGLFASADGEIAWEFPVLGHGLFTYHVLEGLGNPSADADENGWFSAEEVFGYAAPRTTALEPAQHPQLVDNCSGELDFRSVQ